MHRQFYFKVDIPSILFQNLLLPMQNLKVMLKKEVIAQKLMLFKRGRIKRRRHGFAQPTDLRKDHEIHMFCPDVGQGSQECRRALLVVASPRAVLAAASSSMQMWCGCVPRGAFSRWLMSMLRRAVFDIGLEVQAESSVGVSVRPGIQTATVLGRVRARASVRVCINVGVRVVVVVGVGVRVYLVILVSSGRRLLPARSRRSATAAFVSSRDSDARSHLARKTKNRVAQSGSLPPKPPRFGMVVKVRKDQGATHEIPG